VCSGFGKSRTQTEWSFVEGSYFSRARANLKDPAYFSAAGVVDRNIVIPQTGIQTAVAGTLSGVDVFFTGRTAADSYTTNEKTAIRDAVLSGMNLVITADDLEHSIADVFGVTLVDSFRDPEMNSAVSPEHQILAGPFGRITRFRGASDAGHFRGWPAGTLVMAANVEGPTMLLIPASGSSGAVLLISDVDQLTTYLRETAFNNSEPSVPVTDALFMNIVAFLCKPSAPSSAPHLVFPQIANGERNVSSLNLTNADFVANTARVSFRDDNGLPLSLRLVDFGPASNLDENLGSNETATVTTDGVGTLKSGTVTVRASSAEIAGTVMFYAPGLGSTGVPGSEVAGGFVVPVVRQPTGTVPIEVSTGVAVSNLSAKPCILRLELWDESNRRSDGIQSRTIPAYGHFARFLFELYPGFDFRGFRGTLRLVSTDGLISATGLQLGSAAGQFTALPVKAQYR
jgi:hypothetical protein